MSCHLTKGPFKKQHQYILKQRKIMDLKNLYFSYQRQTPAITPVNGFGNAKKKLVEPALFSKC